MTEENKVVKSPISSLSVEREDDRTPDAAELRVGSKTNSKRLAGSIFAKFKEYGYVKLRCIGNGAIGNAFKGYIIASGYLQQNDVEAVCKGAFFKVLLESTEGDRETDGVIITIDVR